MHPLITEAMRKAAVAWLSVGEAPAYPVWCAWVDESLYVITGPGEQPTPGLPGAATATVGGRGDHGGLIVRWPAEVHEVAADSELWTVVVPQLASKRLNSAPAAELAARWSRECTLLRLTPTT